MAAVFGTFRAAVEEHRVRHRHQRLEPQPRRPRAVQGADPGQHRLPRRRPGRGRRAVRRAGRRAGRQPRCLAVRRVRQPPDELRPGATSSGSSTAAPSPRRPAGRPEPLDENFARSIGPDYWEKRKNVFDFKQDVGSFLNRGRMPTYVGDQTRHLQGAGRAGRAHEPGGQGRRHAPGEVGRGSVRRRGPRRGRAHLRQAAGSSTSPAGFDAAYYLYAYPYQRLMLRQRDRLGGLRAAAGRRRGADVRALDRHAAGDRRLRAPDRPPLQRPQHHGLPRPARTTTCRCARRSCRSTTSGSRSRRSIASGASTSSPRGAT